MVSWSRHHLAVALSLLVVTSTILPQPLAAQEPARRISAAALITGSPRLRDGSFSLVGEAAVCGVIPKESSITGVANFVIEVAGVTSGTMTSITFGSRDLTDRVDTTGSFRLTVGVPRAPHYVLNTDPAKTGNIGEASITTLKGVTTLKVLGQNDMNERIELTVTCR